MSLRAWSFAIAIGLTASLGQAQEPAKNGEGSTQSNQTQAQTLPLPIPVEIIEGDAEAAARQNSEKEARQREIDDLAAQEGMNAATQAMNVATQRMVDYAWWSNAFVLAGTILLIATLVLTWLANRAAVKAVRVTREIGNRQLRPYAFCKSVEWEPDDSQKVRFGVENAGQAPAERVEINFTFIRIPELVEDGPKVPRGGFNKIGHVFPKSAVHTISAQSAWDADLKTKQTSARIDGNITYWDPIYKKRRSTSFIFIARGEDGEFLSHGTDGSEKDKA